MLCTLVGCGARPSPAGGAATQQEPTTRPKPVAEVLNASGITGAAYGATLRLRHAGIDVVYYGPGKSADSALAQTQILVRRGDTTGVGRIQAALGSAVITDAPDPARLVDLSVMIGRDYSRPRAAVP